MKHAIAVLAILVVVPLGATENEKWETVSACRDRLKDDVRCFATHARAGMALCGMQWKLGLMKGDLAPAAACQSSAQDAMRPFYQAALKRVSKTREGTAALKDAYAYWVSVIRGLTPAVSEREIDYRRRITEYEQGLEQRLTRLEIEK